jgi:DNA-binding response OmpR family regulator
MSDPLPRPEAGPEPFLVVPRGAFDMDLLSALCADERVELFTAPELTRKWIGFAERVAAVIVATEGDPWDALVYASSASIKAPIIVAMPAGRKPEKKDLITAGAAGCLLLPVDQDDVDLLLHVAAPRSRPSVVNPVLRLLLDPIGLTARYQNKSTHLTHREFAMLHVLNESFGKPVSVQHLFDYVWGDRPKQSASSQQAVATWAYELRRKLKQIGLMKSLVNVRKFGYALKAPEPKRPRGRPRKTPKQ